MARNRKRVPRDRAGRLTSSNGHDDREDVAAPLAHATPDMELAEAQLALGRPELADAQPIADEDEEPNGSGGGRPPAAGALATTGGGGEGRPAPVVKEPLPARLVQFLQGSWRELQRVQWPDRRQVMQATGVVIGFVIVAAAFLGVADWAAGKFVTLILK